jgi:hypothetical protein
MMEFGELQDIDLREAWPHEANDFTLWLAKNLQRLSQVIGIDLELEDTEVPVEGFSADILSRIPTDGSMVVIENQLENANHTHLGQVLTYLAGLEAQTVIWIAREFQGPHLSAIRWLNSHTVDPFAFFAVKVRAVRIGDAPSPVAPLFEVLERPNEWDRRVRVMAETGDKNRSSELGRNHHDFWQFYTNRHPGDFQLRPGYRGSNVFLPVVPGLVISQYLANWGVGIYLRERDRSDAQQTEEMEKYVEALQNELGIDSNHNVLNIDDRWNRNNWPRMANWLHEQLVEYRRIITEQSPETD